MYRGLGGKGGKESEIKSEYTRVFSCALGKDSSGHWGSARRKVAMTGSTKEERLLG